MVAAWKATRGMTLRQACRIALVLVGLLDPITVMAQQPTKIPRIGWLGDDPATTHFREAFRQGLRDLGYVEGRNIVIEYRFAEGKVERFPAIAAELIALNVDVIVGVNQLAAVAATQLTKTIPIVFVAVGDPIGSGLVTSMAHPGGNVTGLSNMSPELVAKGLELLKQVAPDVSRMAVLWQPGAADERTQADRVKRAEVAARALAVQLQLVEARGPADIDQAFSRVTRARAGAVSVLPSVVFFNERKRLVDLAVRNRLPAMYFAREFVDAGGLMAYAANYPDQYRRAAAYVEKILRGAHPGDLPVEQPRAFDLAINLKAARAIRLTIPQSVLARASYVIEK